MVLGLDQVLKQLNLPKSFFFDFDILVVLELDGVYQDRRVWNLSMPFAIKVGNIPLVKAA